MGTVLIGSFMVAVLDMLAEDVAEEGSAEEDYAITYDPCNMLIGLAEPGGQERQLHVRPGQTSHRHVRLRQGDLQLHLGCR
jgi:hypothetical protein